MRHKLMMDVNPLVEMEKLRDLISQESISIAGIKRSVADLIPSLQNNFKSFLSRISGSASSETITLKASDREFLALIQTKPFLNLESIPAEVPEGMTSTFKGYAHALQAAATHVSTNTEKSMAEYSRMLAQIVTNKDMKVSMMPNNAKYRQMESQRDQLTKAMGNCFSDGSSNTKSTYGEVVQSNTEWRDVFMTMTALMDLLNRMNRDKLQEQAEECSELLGTIIKQIKNGEFEQAGPEVLDNLADGAYQCGAELELFSVVYFKATVLATAITDTMNNVEKALAEKEAEKQAA